MQATILIVDDTPTNISVLMEILRGDYRVLAAVNGEQALKIARGDPPPDLILLDVMMPGMSGHEVCQRLKAESSTRKIPVTKMTGILRVLLSAFRRWHTSWPLIPGIITSSRINSGGGSPRAIFNACSPLVAARTR